MRTSITPDTVAAFLARRTQETRDSLNPWLPRDAFERICYVRLTRRGARPAKVTR